MVIQAIFVGSELLRGKINLNLSILSSKLSTIGLKIKKAITVSDNVEDMKEVFKEAVTESQIVFISGGLGPTFDDKTIEVVSSVLKKKTVFSREVMQMIAAYFVRKGREIPKNIEKQAYIVSGAKILENKRGTAHGEFMELKTKNKIIILLPGPPQELSGLMDDEVIPILKKKFEKKILKRNVYHIAGIRETEIEKDIKEIKAREFEEGDVNFSILPEVGEVHIEVCVEGEDELVVEEIVKKIELEIYDALGDKIYGKNEETLSSVIGKLIAKEKATLSVAESLTGGLISDMITDTPGSSLYFLGSVIVYSNYIKKKELGVKEETIKKFGAVSQECVIEMLKGLRERFNTYYTIVTTGIAGPSGGTKEKPVGLVYIGCGKKDEFEVKKYIFTGSRRMIKEKTAKYALSILRKKILNV